MQNYYKQKSKKKVTENAKNAALEITEIHTTKYESDNKKEFRRFSPENNKQ